MNISKLTIVRKYLFGGGIASVIEYILDQFNKLVATLPAEEVAKYAQLAKDFANFARNLAATLITNEAKKSAATATAAAFDTLATALLDSTITRDELDAVIASVKAAVAAWKEAK